MKRNNSVVVIFSDNLVSNDGHEKDQQFVHGGSVRGGRGNARGSIRGGRGNTSGSVRGGRGIAHGIVCEDVCGNDYCAYF